MNKEEETYVNRRAIKTVCYILLMGLVFTGCSNSLKSENDSLKKELEEAKTKISNLESENKDLKNQLEEQKKSNEKTNESINNKDNIYTIYTANSDTYEKQPDAYVYISNTSDLKQKLTVIANVLSEGYFSNLPIEVVKIEETYNKKIAVIDLKDNNEKNWVSNYLQGSAGGAITSTALIETFLQREHSGEWIDGVRFLYNGGVCEENIFQHAPDLTKVNYR